MNARYVVRSAGTDRTVLQAPLDFLLQINAQLHDVFVLHDPSPFTLLALKR